MKNKKCLNSVIATDHKDYALLIIRLSLWVFILAHWLQKMFWLFWWYWFEASIWFFANLGVPYFIALLVIIWETFWAAFLLLWFFTRIMAWAILVIMIWAIALVHFKMWYFDYEMLLLAIAMAFALVMKWWWALSLDSFMKKHI